ncbi:M48 family metalloprotease [Actinoplanes sp. NPDC049599]|uniref:M48 family metalloprotease n=1 Tax=Actinoplanes sp. NPDC049599 TaxID=3363903 RepID=UPI0037A3388B
MICPRCFTAATSARGATPWCPSCEWNLDHFEPSRRRPELGWRWADRATHRVAWRLTAGQFVRLADGPLRRRGASAARAVTLTVAVLLLLLVALFAGLGTWLILYDFPRFTILPGVALLGMAVALRPRVGGLAEETHLLDRDEAPELWALVDRVAAHTGAPVPHFVGLDYSLGAYTTVVGLRRRRVLCLGAVLWSALDQQERVALLGHELGHFVNGDLRRGPLVQIALTTLGRMAEMTRPGQSGLNGFVDLLVGIVQGLLSRLILGVHLLVVWIGQRDAQRAEYLADEIGARAAGSAAAVRLLDVLLMQEALETVIRREARAGRSGAAWRTAAAVARASLAAAVPALRQLSQRDETSLFASHPPTGLRARMLERRPQQPAGVVLTEQQAERIDREIAGPVERIRRDLATAG